MTEGTEHLPAGAVVSWRLLGLLIHRGPVPPELVPSEAQRLEVGAWHEQLASTPSDDGS